jgi:hypothetical protein
VNLTLGMRARRLRRRAPRLSPKPALRGEAGASSTGHQPARVVTLSTEWVEPVNHEPTLLHHTEKPTVEQLNVSST